MVKSERFHEHTHTHIRLDGFKVRLSGSRPRPETSCAFPTAHVTTLRFVLFKSYKFQLQKCRVPKEGYANNSRERTTCTPRYIFVQPFLADILRRHREVFKLTVLLSYGFLVRACCLELGTPPPSLAMFGCANRRQTTKCTSMEIVIFIRTSATTSLEEYGGGKYVEYDWITFATWFVRRTGGRRCLLANFDYARSVRGRHNVSPWLASGNSRRICWVFLVHFLCNKRVHREGFHHDLSSVIV